MATIVGPDALVVAFPWEVVTIDAAYQKPEPPPAPGIAVRADGRLVFASDALDGAKRVAIE